MAAIGIDRVTAALGAEIRGVELREPRAPAVVREIEQALLEHGVLFFREQDIDPEQQKAFARHFGEISVPPFAPKHGSDPEYIVLDQVAPKGQGADQWHSDNTFIERPPMGSILKAVKLPREAAGARRVSALRSAARTGASRSSARKSRSSARRTSGRCRRRSSTARATRTWSSSSSVSPRSSTRWFGPTR